MRRINRSDQMMCAAYAALVFMVAEGYRVGMRRLWAYVLLALAVAISVALPVFLLVRQLRLATELACRA